MPPPDSKHRSGSVTARLSTEARLSTWRNIRLVVTVASLVITLAAKAAGVLNWAELGFGILGVLGLAVVVMLLEQIQEILVRTRDDVGPKDAHGIRVAIARAAPILFYLFAVLFGLVGICLVLLGLFYVTVQVQQSVKASSTVSEAQAEARTIVGGGRLEVDALREQFESEVKERRKASAMPPRIRYSHTPLPVRVQRADMKWGQTTGDPGEDSEQALYRRSMDDWFHWILRGGGPVKGESSSQLLVVELGDTNAFTEYYDDIHCVVKVNRELNLEQGVCFLISEDAGATVYRPIFRQMPMKLVPDDSGKSYRNELTLIRPNSGDKMLMILRVRRQNGQPCEADPAWYEVRVDVL